MPLFTSSVTLTNLYRRFQEKIKHYLQRNSKAKVRSIPRTEGPQLVSTSPVQNPPDKEVGAAVLHGDDNDNDGDDNESTPEVNTITASDAPLDSIKGKKPNLPANRRTSVRLVVPEAATPGGSSASTSQVDIGESKVKAVTMSSRNWVTHTWGRSAR